MIISCSPVLNRNDSTSFCRPGRYRRTSVAQSNVRMREKKRTRREGRGEVREVTNGTGRARGESERDGKRDVCSGMERPWGRTGGSFVNLLRFFLFLSVDGKKHISRSTNNTTRGRPVLWRSCGANRARSAHRVLRVAWCEEGKLGISSHIRWLEQFSHVLLRLARQVQHQRRVVHRRPVLHALVLYYNSFEWLSFVLGRVGGEMEEYTSINLRRGVRFGSNDKRKEAQV